MIFPAFWSEFPTAALVNHLWQSTVFVLIAWLLTLLLRNNQARARDPGMDDRLGEIPGPVLAADCRR